MARQQKPLTQTQFIAEMAERTGLTKSQVKDFYAYQHDLVLEQLTLPKIGKVTIPLIKTQIKLVKKPATKARKGRNPATGEEMMIGPKPARKVVKSLVLKSFKDTVIGFG